MLCIFGIRKTIDRLLESLISIAEPGNEMSRFEQISVCKDYSLDINPMLSIAEARLVICWISFFGLVLSRSSQSHIRDDSLNHDFEIKTWN